MLFEPTAGHGKNSETAIAARRAADPQLASRLDEISEFGFCVIEGAFSVKQVQRTKTQLAPWLQGKLMGRNNFEGQRSERVYALLAKAPSVTCPASSVDSMVGSGDWPGELRIPEAL